MPPPFTVMLPLPVALNAQELSLSNTMMPLSPPGGPPDPEQCPTARAEAESGPEKMTCEKELSTFKVITTSTNSSSPALGPERGGWFTSTVLVAPSLLNALSD